jgi:transposase
MKRKEKREPESIIKEIKRKARRKFNSEEKIRIVLEGLQGESSIAVPKATSTGDISVAKQ